MACQVGVNVMIPQGYGDYVELRANASHLWIWSLDLDIRYHGIKCTNESFKINVLFTWWLACSLCITAQYTNSKN